MMSGTMENEQQIDKYIICTKCKCKYINDDEHIKRDFGYSRIEKPYKTCCKCREKRRSTTLKVYLYENVEAKTFSIKFQFNKKAEKFNIRYTKSGRDEGYKKANEKIAEIQKQYDDDGVVIINKTTTEED